MLASKFFDDLYYNNAYYARVGGISNAEVNNLEMEMLHMISFSLCVSAEQYERYRDSLYDQIRWKPMPALAMPAVLCAPLPLQREPSDVMIDQHPHAVQAVSMPVAGGHAPFHGAMGSNGFHMPHQTAFVS
jgi:hypothetical protein